MLSPLRESFNHKHYELYKLYATCSEIRYLTSLISIPKLDRNPPDFLAQGPPTKPPRRPITPPPPKEPEFDHMAQQQAEVNHSII